MTTSDSDYGARYRKTVMVSGRRTSISVEGEMWQSLNSICQYEKVLLPDLLTKIDQRRENASLASSIRSVCVIYWREVSGFDKWPQNSLAETPTPFVPFPASPERGSILDRVLKTFSDHRRARLRALAEENQNGKPVRADHFDA